MAGPSLDLTTDTNIGADNCTNKMSRVSGEDIGFESAMDNFNDVLDEHLRGTEGTEAIGGTLSLMTEVESTSVDQESVVVTTNCNTNARQEDLQWSTTNKDAIHVESDAISGQLPECEIECPHDDQKDAALAANTDPKLVEIPVVKDGIALQVRESNEAQEPNTFIETPRDQMQEQKVPGILSGHGSTDVGAADHKDTCECNKGTEDTDSQHETDVTAHAAIDPGSTRDSAVELASEFEVTSTHTSKNSKRENGDTKPPTVDARPICDEPTVATLLRGATGTVPVAPTLHWKPADMNSLVLAEEQIHVGGDSIAMKDGTTTAKADLDVNCKVATTIQPLPADGRGVRPTLGDECKEIIADQD
ncbi:hypothetical protein HK102_001944, partial [Quaeritorhiza haematococci]